MQKIPTLRLVAVLVLSNFLIAFNAQGMIQEKLAKTQQKLLDLKMSLGALKDALSNLKNTLPTKGSVSSSGDKSSKRKAKLIERKAKSKKQKEEIKELMKKLAASEAQKTNVVPPGPGGPPPPPGAGAGQPGGPPPPRGGPPPPPGAGRGPQGAKTEIPEKDALAAAINAITAIPADELPASKDEAAKAKARAVVEAVQGLYKVRDGDGYKESDAMARVIAHAALKSSGASQPAVVRVLRDALTVLYAESNPKAAENSENLVRSMVNTIVGKSSRDAEKAAQEAAEKQSGVQEKFEAAFRAAYDIFKENESWYRQKNETKDKPFLASEALPKLAGDIAVGLVQTVQKEDIAKALLNVLGTNPATLIRDLAQKAAGLVKAEQLANEGTSQDVEQAIAKGRDAGQLAKTSEEKVMQAALVAAHEGEKRGFDLAKQARTAARAAQAMAQDLGMEYEKSNLLIARAITLAINSSGASKPRPTVRKGYWSSALAAVGLGGQVVMIGLSSEAPKAIIEDNQGVLLNFIKEQIASSSSFRDLVVELRKKIDETVGDAYTPEVTEAFKSKLEAILLNKFLARPAKEAARTFFGEGATVTDEVINDATKSAKAAARDAAHDVGLAITDSDVDAIAADAVSEIVQAKKTAEETALRKEGLHQVIGALKSKQSLQNAINAVKATIALQRKLLAEKETDALVDQVVVAAQNKLKKEEEDERKRQEAEEKKQRIEAAKTRVTDWMLNELNNNVDVKVVKEGAAKLLKDASVPTHIADTVINRVITRFNVSSVCSKQIALMHQLDQVDAKKWSEQKQRDYDAAKKVISNFLLAGGFSNAQERQKIIAELIANPDIKKDPAG